MKKSKVVIFLGVLMCTLCAFTQDIVKRTEPKEYKGTTGNVFRYRLAEKISADGKKGPLVIFLHGAGERGTDNKAQLLHGITELVTWLDANESSYKLIAGQVPQGQRWVEVHWGDKKHITPSSPSQTMQLLIEFVEKLLDDPSVDASRVYVTGISMGGFGTWDLITRKSDLFSAAMPICGGGDVSKASQISKIPIWTFHGSNDGAVPVSRSRDMVSALWAVGSNAHYREYPGDGHNVWTKTYRDKTVLKWFFSQRKSTK